jgi:hypothetical protein
MNRVRWPSNHFHAFALVALVCSAGDLFAQDRSLELFTNGVVPRILITIPPEGLAELRVNPRQYVKAAVREGTNVWREVGIHLKGAVGSFRGIDGKAAFTVSFEKFAPEQRFHGLRKIYLNNSVEDASYMNELVGGELFRAAGLPAPLVTHAVVEINDKPLGLYVLKEGFAEEFLARHFRHPDGNLYDIGPGHDVDEPLTRDLGKGPDDATELTALTEAALESDVVRRWQKLERTLEVDRFISFMAMEILLGHRDGYCLARNNFRVYQDVDSGRVVFFSHGMDQLFGNPRALVEPRMSGLVARSLMEIPEGRRAYRKRCAVLLTNVFRLKQIDQTIDAALLRLRPVLANDAATALQSESAALKGRIASRIKEVEKQLAVPPLELLRFENGVTKVRGWQSFDIPVGGSMAETNTSDGKRALLIRAGPLTSASWRTKVLLARGEYRFEGSVRTASVEPLGFGKNHGAMLRVTQVPAARPPPLLGTQSWKTLQVLFEITEREQELELVCDLRGRAGTAWFDLESLRLVRR